MRSIQRVLPISVAILGITWASAGQDTVPAIPAVAANLNPDEVKELRAEDAKKDKDVLKELQGTWALDRVMYQGDQVERRRYREPSGLIRPALWTIKADTIKMEHLYFMGGPDDKPSATFKLGLNGKDERILNPQAIDLFLSPGGLHWQGIYKFEGDELHLCLRHRGRGGRPVTFETDKAVETHILVLKRYSDARKPAGPKAPAKRAFPDAPTTHKQIAEFKVRSTDGKHALQTIGLDTDGNVLCLAAEPKRLGAPLKNTISEVLVYSKDGKLLRTMTINFHANAVTGDRTAPFTSPAPPSSPSSTGPAARSPSSICPT